MKAKLASVLLVTALLAVLAPAGAAQAYQRGMCAVPTKNIGFTTCDSGSAHPSFRVAMIGDSHTREWFEPVRILAAKYNWNLTVVSKSACPPLDPTMMPTVLPSKSCIPWNEKLQTYIKKQKPFDLVINSSSSFVTKGYKSFGKAFASVVSELTARGSKVLVIRDNPKPLATFDSCLAQNGMAHEAVCARPRTDALTPDDPMVKAVAGMKHVKVADFTNSFCRPTVCYPVIQGIKVYRDHSHISKDWALHLLYRVDSAIPPEFKAGVRG
jgi:hypothetical protein